MSFFAEVIKFFSQFVESSNWFSDQIESFLNVFKESIEWAKNFSSSGIPPVFAWVLPLVLAATVFEFIRGR